MTMMILSVIQVRTHGRGNQKWILHPDGTIINPESGKALDVSGSGTTNGTKIQIWDKNGSVAQKWEIYFAQN